MRHRVLPLTKGAFSMTKTAKIDNDTNSGVHRRRFLQVLGAGAAGVVALPWLAACGSSSKSAGGGASTGSTASGSSAAAGGGFGTVTLDSVKTLLGVDKLDAKTLGTGKSMKITAQLALTGTISFYGGVMTNGMNLAVKHIKAMGGPDITLTFQDNKGGDAQSSISGARELIANGEQFMASSIGASLGAILPTIANANVVCFNTGSGAPVAPWTAAKNYWEPDGNTNLITPFFSEFLVKQYPGKKKLFIVSADGGSQANAEGIALAKASLIDPWEIVGVQYVVLGSSDFSGIVSKISAANPDAISAPLASGAMGQFIKAYRQTGGQAPVIETGAPPSTDDFAAAGSQMAGLIFLGALFNVNAPENPWGQFFLNEYYAAYGKKPGLPDLYATNYYVQVYTWWQCWQDAWSKGTEPTAASVNAFLETGPKLWSVYGGDKSTVGFNIMDPKTHFASMEIGAYQLQKDQSYKQIARSNPDGTGYNKVS
jgi:branched-chain amino acid transport system substrate-binding protein